MILQNQPKNIKSSANLQSASCSIDAEDMRYIASLLRNNYSDTILATMREIIANAIDVSDGKKVDVQLPTRIEPNFIVRDYGTGLSEDDMMGLYTKYGKSTKRGSNNAIGGFGIGRFAPLSYTESFIVVSVNGDCKTSYSIRVDENDDTVVSRLCSELNSEERNGIYIQVPIENQHIENFNSKFKNFSRYIQGSLNVKNHSFYYIDPEISCDVFDYFTDENTSYSYSKSSHEECNRPSVLMGGIMYPVSKDGSRPNFVDGLVYKAEIGEFKLHHSREALEYNNGTIQKLEQASYKISLALKESLKSQYDSCDCLYEATNIKGSIQRKYGRYFSKEATNVEFDSNKFGNQTVETTLFPNKMMGEFETARVIQNNRGNLSISKKGGFNNDDLSPSENRFFIIDDGVKPRSILNRLSFLTGIQKAMVFTSTDESVVKKLIDRSKLMKSANVKLLSECERTISKRTKSQNSSNSLLAGSDILSFSTDNCCYNQSDFWKAQKEDLPDSETYYYVKYYSNKFQKISGESFPNGDSPSCNSDLVKSLMRINPSLKKVYGIRHSSLKKVASMDNWIPLESVYIDWIKNSEKIIDKVNHDAVNEKLRDRFGNHAYKLFNLIPRISKEIPSNELIKTLKNALSKTQDTAKNNRSVQNLVNLGFVNPTISKEKKAIEDFDKKYPLVKRIIQCVDRYSDEELSDIFDYIKSW
jgi:hypothetical protein